MADHGYVVHECDATMIHRDMLLVTKTKNTKFKNYSIWQK